MDLAEFEATKLQILASAPPSSGYDLLGMETDFMFLLARGRVDDSSVRVRKTDNPARLIEACCRADEGVDLRTAAGDIEEIWLTQLRYGYFEAHVLRVDDERATLDFITQIHDGGFYVSGRVVIAPSGSSPRRT